MSRLGPCLKTKAKTWYPDIFMDSFKDVDFLGSLEEEDPENCHISKHVGAQWLEASRTGPPNQKTNKQTKKPIFVFCTSYNEE